MTQQIINIGSAANDGTGDPLRTAMSKARDNFAELYTQNNKNVAQFSNSPFLDTEDGLYSPVINANELSNTTGLTNHASGGVVAAVSGVTGTGDMFMPRAIDMTKPWRSAILIEINDSDSITELHFCDQVADSFTGLRFTKISNTGITGTFTATTASNNYGSTGGIPTGTKIWICMSYDGVSAVTWNLIPENTAPLRYSVNTSPPANGAWTGYAYGTKRDPAIQSSGKNCFGGTGIQAKYNLCRLRIATASAQNRIIGVWWNQGLGNPKDGLLQPPACMQIKVLNDETGWVIIPKTLGVVPTDIVQSYHPSSNNGGFSVLDTATGNPTELAKIVDGGYLLCGITGADIASDLTGATSTNWGASSGTRYRKALTEWVKANIPNTRNLFMLGNSMGALCSLRYASQHVGQVKGIACVSGAYSLLDCYNTLGFNTLIDQAYGVWYLTLSSITGLNPSLVVTAAGNSLIGAITLTVSALSSQVPSGTTLTLLSGTGPTTVVTTALAASGATSITVSALTAQVNNTAKFDTTAHFTPLTQAYTQVPDVYYTGVYIWRNVYVQATAYSANDIIIVPAAGATGNTYRFADPNLTISPFKSIPMKIWHGDADVTIPLAQAQSFRTTINNEGGNCTLVTVSGGTHLGPTIFDGAGIVSFFNSLN